MTFCFPQYTLLCVIVFFITANALPVNQTIKTRDYSNDLRNFKQITELLYNIRSRIAIPCLSVKSFGLNISGIIEISPLDLAILPSGYCYSCDTTPHPERNELASLEIDQSKNELVEIDEEQLMVICAEDGERGFEWPFMGLCSNQTDVLKSFLRDLRGEGDKVVVPKRRLATARQWTFKEWDDKIMNTTGFYSCMPTGTQTACSQNTAISSDDDGFVTKTTSSFDIVLSTMPISTGYNEQDGTTTNFAPEYTNIQPTSTTWSDMQDSAKMSSTSSTITTVLNSNTDISTADFTSSLTSIKQKTTRSPLSSSSTPVTAVPTSASVLSSMSTAAPVAVSLSSSNSTSETASPVSNSNYIVKTVTTVLAMTMEITVPYVNAPAVTSVITIGRVTRTATITVEN